MGYLTTEKNKFGRLNRILLILLILLLGCGLLNLHSASKFWGDLKNASLIYSQTMWIGIGLLGMTFFAFFDYRFFKKAAFHIYILSIIALVSVLFFGKTVAGHKSWLSLGHIVFQPSEFAKLALVIFLAAYFSKRPSPEGSTLTDMWKPILFSVIPTVLVILQGDLGAAIFFGLIFVTFAWFGKLRRRGVVTLIFMALLGSIILFSFGLSNYQKARITNFLNPGADMRGSGYHLTQAKIAVGSGQLLGKGYLEGNINKLKYLPEKHTDFIFTVLAEEWGFVGSLIVLFLYFLLLFSGIEIAKKARDRFGLFIAVGIVALLFWQIVINLGGVLGLMPLTGVTLPFMSYGGSSMVIMLSSMGILLSVSMRRFLF